MILNPDTLFHGRYSVVRCLQVGGMGAVYEVVDKATQSRRALKVLLPDTLKSADLRSRFEREATVTGAIESDHVVRTTDAGLDEETGMPFMVMELLRGEELAAVVARQGHLPPDEAMLYLRQAALGLDKVHAHGIVHRDLKPQNLFVTVRDDGSPNLKIIDFGIAKSVATAQEIKKTRAIGTPPFMAPEQISGDGQIGPGADLYAFGHVAYMLLTGEPYWNEEADEADSVQSFVGCILVGATEPASARALRRMGVVLPPAFDGWFARATAVRPEQRFGHATESVSALAEALGLPAGMPRTPLTSSSPAEALAPHAPGMKTPMKTPHALGMKTPHAPGMRTPAALVAHASSAPLEPTPPHAPGMKTTSPLSREASEHPLTPSRIRFLLPTIAAALLVLAAAAVALRMRSPAPPEAASAAADQGRTPVSSISAAPAPAPLPASPPNPTASVVGDAPPASSPAAPPSASPRAASQPATGPATRPAPSPRPPPRDNNPAPRHPGID